jgi:hypothetical protein
MYKDFIKNRPTTLLDKSIGINDQLPQVHAFIYGIKPDV